MIKNHEEIDARKVIFKYLSENPKYYFLISFFVIVGIFLSIITFSIGFLFLPLFFILVIFVAIPNFIRSYLMRQFAQNLGFSYSMLGDMSSVEGALFEVGNKKIITDVISGRDDKHEMKLFFYYFTVGQGKHSHTYNYTVFENTFGGNMPHILVQPKRRFFENYINLGFYGGDKISLEGDFNKYFSIIVEKEFEIEAYQIFSPDFMEKLIHTSKRLGFEFYKNKLYIYSKHLINKMSEIDDMFRLCDELSDHIEPVNQRIGSDVDSMREAIDKYTK